MSRTNSSLIAAKKAKNDEFYTQWHDIEMEINAYLEANPNLFRGKTVLCPCDDPEWSNFTKFFAHHFQDFGLKKLISTSYAPGKTGTHGKLFVLDRDTHHGHRVDIDDLHWQYLQGDGDFRSPEVTALLQEADMVITNPPFSLFREFFVWLTDAHKQFAIIGSINAIVYRDVFPLFKDKKIWTGATNGREMVFGLPEGAEAKEAGKPRAARLGYVGNYSQMRNSRWYTNIEHGYHPAPLRLMTMADNLKFSRHRIIREQGYPKYDNYHAIEVPYVDAIPCDYPGVMGVPISFIDKYCPEQFEIVGAIESWAASFSPWLCKSAYNLSQPIVNGKLLYKRLLIKKRSVGRRPNAPAS